MKKTYTKPEMSFESFELSTSVAAGCSGATQNYEWFKCAIDIGDGKTLFVNLGDCTVIGDLFPNQYAEDYPCYDNSQNSNLWTS